MAPVFLKWLAFGGADPQVMKLGKVNAAGPVPNLDKMQALDAWYQGELAAPAK